jgi:hypothetical protein
MNQRVSFFRLEEGTTVVAMPAKPAAAAPAAAKSAAIARPAAKTAPAPAPVHAPAPKRAGPVGRMQSQLATALKQDQDWQEF